MDEKVSVEIVDQEEEYKEWLVFSNIDYECAVYLNKAPMNPRPLNVICYHCQQAAEKAAKALIVYFGSQGGMPKVHDVQFLLEQVKNIILDRKGIQIEDDLMDKAESLTKYGTAPRYPNEIDVDEYATRKALKDSEVIIAFVRDAIQAPEKS